MSLNRIVISGFAGCNYFKNVVNIAKCVQKEVPSRLEYTVLDHPTWTHFHNHRQYTLIRMGVDPELFANSPFVYTVTESKMPQLVICGEMDAFRSFIKHECGVNSWRFG